MLRLPTVDPMISDLLLELADHVNSATQAYNNLSVNPQEVIAAEWVRILACKWTDMEWHCGSVPHATLHWSCHLLVVSSAYVQCILPNLEMKTNWCWLTAMKWQWLAAWLYDGRAAGASGRCMQPCMAGCILIVIRTAKREHPQFLVQLSAS